MTLLRKMDSKLNRLMHMFQTHFKSDNAMKEVGWIQMADVEALQDFNETLADEKKFNEVCAVLQLLGGKDVTDSTKRIMTKLLKHNLTLKINWTGRFDKFCFSNMKNIVGLIHAAVRKNPLTKDATLNEVEYTIKSWLRGAGDRDGGRRNRAINKSLKLLY